MKSDAITFPKPTLDQAMCEAFDFSGHSPVSPDFFIFDESNIFPACFCAKRQSCCRRHNHFRIPIRLDLLA